MLLLLSNALSGQNLVPNPSFESIGTAPCSWITSPAQFTGAVNNWTMPSTGSTDIFSNYVATSCYAHNFSTHSSRVGQQAPHSGNVMSALNNYGSGCGFQPNYREYLQVQLTTPLTVGQSYDIEFYVSLGDRCTYATNNIGVRFNTTSTFISTCFVINQAPQFNLTSVISDKTNWVLVSGTVTATAAWRYIIIGNFFSNAATTAVNVGGTRDNTRYYIDDVSVQEAVVLPAPELILHGERDAQGLIDLEWPLLENPEDGSYRKQRSGDGQNWETVSRVPGVNDAEVLSWTDHFPPAGDLFYRVRYRDQNGLDRVSNLVNFQGKDNPYYLQFTNHPVASDQPVLLRIGQADDAPASLEVIDLNGRGLWARENLTVREVDGFSIPAGTFTPGMYVVRMTTSKGVVTRRLVIQ